MTQSGPKCEFSWLYLFPVKSYRNFIISIVFYCFRPLWRHNLPNIDMTVLIFSIQAHFMMIHHLWKFHLFSISKTHLKNRGGHKVPSPMYGVAQNRPCEVGLMLLWSQRKWFRWKKVQIEAIHGPNAVNGVIIGQFMTSLWTKSSLFHM